MGKRSGVVLVAALLVVAVVLFSGVLKSEKEPAASEPSTSTEVGAMLTDSDSACCALPTMLELGSEGCVPCEKMKPVMAELNELHAGRIRIEFHDVRKDREIAAKYGIRLIPTQIFLKQDGTEFFRHEGFFPRQEIEKVFRDMGTEL